ncbi:hypothetical protein LguiA_026122 [Lonicera macranthoides]
MADDQYTAAIAKNQDNNEEGYNQDDNSSILKKNFPPLGESSLVTKQPSQSIKNKTTEGSEYVLSPLKTRAQRQKKDQPLSLTKQLKAKKTVNRELKAYSRRSKSAAQPQTSDPDVFQWQLYEKDKKMREDETAAAKSNDEQHQWKRLGGPGRWSLPWVEETELPAISVHSRFMKILDVRS